CRKDVYGLYAPLSAYDEGILLTNTMLVMMGQVPYRDFYSNYPPGIYLTLAAIFKIFGATARVARVLGLTLRLALVALAARLGGRIVGRRFSLLVAGIAG